MLCVVCRWDSVDGKVTFTLELSPQEFTGDSPEKAAARAVMAGAQATLKQIEDDEVGWYSFTLSNLSCNHLELSS